MKTISDASAREQTAELSRLEELATLMDSAVRIPGIGVRVGIDAIVGLLPGAGDLLTGIVSAWIVYRARRAGAKWTTVMRMGVNILLDVGIGAIPLAGDVFDVLWRTNQRNVALLRRDLTERAKRLRAEPPGPSAQLRARAGNV